MAKSKKAPSAKQLAWRGKFASMYGGKTKRVSSMAKGKKNGVRRQGIVSWGINVITLLIALANPIARVAEATQRPKGDKWPFLARAFCYDYAGFYPKIGAEGDNSFDAKRMIRGYAPIAAAYGFKKGMTMITKTAKIQSLIPRLTAS